MILFFKSWCENIIIGVVISVIIEMICPERFLKYIKIVIGIYIIYLIVMPIVDNLNFDSINVFFEDICVNSDLLDENQKRDKDLNIKVDGINKTFMEGLETTIEEKVKSEIGMNIDLNIEYDDKTFQILKIKVNKDNYGSFKDEKDIDNINNIILKEIDIDKSKIVYN